MGHDLQAHPALRLGVIWRNLADTAQLSPKSAEFVIIPMAYYPGLNKVLVMMQITLQVMDTKHSLMKTT